ncbi:hypothetical protein D3C71_1298170 [compost metagenome]
MTTTQHRRQPARQRLVGQQRIQVHRHLRHRDRMPARGHAVVQVGQGLCIVEPADLRHHAVQQVQETLRLGHKGMEPLAPVHAFGLAVLVEQLRRACTALLGRQVDQGEVVAALEVARVLLEGCAAFLVDQPGQRLGKQGQGIVGRLAALGFHEQRPARAQAAQRIVEPRRCGDQLALRRAVQVRTAKARRALERAVLVEHDTGCNQSGPGQPVGQQRGTLAVFGEVQHGGFSITGLTRPAARGA